MDVEITKDVIARIKKVMPSPFIMKIKRDKEGKEFILGYLFSHKDENVFSKDLAAFSGLSTARIAAALNTLEEEKLIKRQAFNKDKRKTLVKLTEEGEKKCNEREEEMFNFCSQIIDKIGLEKINEYIKTCGEINEAVHEIARKEKRDV